MQNSGATKPVPFVKNEQTNHVGLAKIAHEKQWMVAVVAVISWWTLDGCSCFLLDSRWLLSFLVDSGYSNIFPTFSSLYRVSMITPATSHPQQHTTFFLFNYQLSTISGLTCVHNMTQLQSVRHCT